MLYFLAGLSLLLGALVVVMAGYIVRTRNARKQRGLIGPWPIRKVAIDAFDEAFRCGPFGPGLAAEVRFVGRGNLPVTGGLGDVEYWILAVLAKRARRLFEFGTCTGRTTYMWAANAPPDAVVTTLTLAPGQVSQYAAGTDDDPAAARVAAEESGFSDFLYSGTPEASKIEQLYGDSKAFDETPYVGRCDLVFVDGSHAYSYVKSDSEKALRMVRPGGLVLWHDYHGPRRAPGVWRALNELNRRHALVHLAGTNLVAYRRPAAGPTSGL
ncbi:MAG: O-methyltransferase [Kiloniellales bacterium]